MLRIKEDAVNHLFIREVHNLSYFSDPVPSRSAISFPRIPDMNLSHHAAPAIPAHCREPPSPQPPPLSTRFTKSPTACDRTSTSFSFSCSGYRRRPLFKNSVDDIFHRSVVPLDQIQNSREHQTPPPAVQHVQPLDQAVESHPSLLLKNVGAFTSARLFPSSPTFPTESLSF